LKTRR